MLDVMERTISGARIKRIGRGIYEVKSNSRSFIPPYQVDLQENDGLGTCQCESFIYNLYPHWKKVKANYDFFRCRHIKDVRNHVMDQIIAHYADRKEDGA